MEQLIVHSYEELETYVGKVLGISEYHKVTQDQINKFADATHDHQWIHVDPERAKTESPFGATIAHGYLTLSLLPYLQASIDGFLMPKGMKMAMNYGFDKLRFMAPVKEGKRVRAVATLLDAKEKRDGQWLLTFSFTVEIEGEDKPALIAEWLLMYFV